MASFSHQPLLQKPNGSDRKPLCVVLSLATILSVACMFGPQLLLTASSSPQSMHPRQICEGAHDQQSCLNLLSEVITSNTTMDMLQIFLESSVNRVHQVMKSMTENISNGVNNLKEQSALADCMELLDLSMDRLRTSMVALKNQDNDGHDAHSWLSSVLTNHVTCLDGLEEGSPSRAAMEPELHDLIGRARASLAIFVSLPASPPRKKTAASLMGMVTDEFPSWITHEDRKLLRADARAVKANVVVAKDESGKYKTVAEAVAAAPDKSAARYVIYVKKGVYRENVEIGKSKMNLMIMGDGMDATVITGSLNFVDGTTTFKTATVAAVGDGFMAQDLWFQNSAGPQKHQAVALRVGADKSVINRCRIDAYQDTLYTHTLRQFYRDCYITGTVDFIFGNAAVVLQNCKLVARRPMDKQSNMVTAQGREDPNQNTGTSIQNCDIIASSDLAPVKANFKTYLGRPWKLYSRTVVMQSNIGDHIDPTGWAPWDKDFALKTLYYGEYQNTGAGASTGRRVNWPGYHVITDAAEARKFTVAGFIQGGSWLQSTGVTYKESL